MKAHKKGNRYQISYRCPGYDKIINEYFDTLPEANLRIAEIEVCKMKGTLQPPSHLLDPNRNLTKYRQTVTVRQLMEEYITAHGLTHWSVSTLSCNRHRIEDYIIPYLGDVKLKDLTTRGLEQYYQNLLSKPAVKTRGHENEQKTVSPDVIKKVHDVIRNALNQAIRLDYLRGVNPALAVELPKYKQKPVATWSDQEVVRALQLCEDPILQACILLAIGCSLRIGEILGLTWDCVHISEELIREDSAWLRVEKELLRCDSQSLDDLKKQGRDDTMVLIRSYKDSDPTTRLVLKHPKTESSIRTNYIPKTVARALLKLKSSQDAIRAEFPLGYDDYNLVICQNNGRPYEATLIRKKLRDLYREHQLAPITFHSLRHSSTTIKLKLSGGDIKSVQVNTGHSVADMVTNVYSEIQDEDRRQLSSQMERDFFSRTSPGSRDTATLSKRQEKSSETLRFRNFLELLARFELATSSLPRMRSTD